MALGVVSKINGGSAEGDDDDDGANNDDGSTGRNNRNRKHNQKKARQQKRTAQKNHKKKQGKTYAVKFDDGDFDPGVPASDIRYTPVLINKGMLVIGSTLMTS
jgi:hypothetical protein